ncbi:hypothetical protein SRB5_17650 [Streptomyces sp. RB5]|uniref:Aldehyde dehydrogenase domain-containing protein n=1 Tax=Streptomyces smaragdinus TaxID=2585196 RepID=A0A7K0CE53_9ACTN|nr:aldehyde dehydrogenase family protein [Streptomyces smaragdinus]MQY11646.1 hypothetical protein [Streptomyces smaragdinus]
MSRRSMPVLESFTRTWLDLEAAHTTALSAATALLRGCDQVLAVLTRTATCSSARDELMRSAGVLCGAPRELARTCPPRLGKLCVRLPAYGTLWAYTLSAVVPALYTDEVVVHAPEGFEESTALLHRVVSRLLPPALAGRLRLTDGRAETFRRECANANAVFWSGDPDAGRQLMAELDTRTLFLLRGTGPNPLVIGPRTDPAAACRTALRTRLHNSGQDGLCPDVIFVHRLRLDAVVDRLRAELSVLTVGARSWPDTVLAPLTTADGVERAAGFVEEYADHLVIGGAADRQRRTVEAALLVLPEDAGFHPPELLAPLFCVVPYHDPQSLREWARDPVELARGMYVSVLGEPRLTGETLGTAVLVRNSTALDLDDGNQPMGGYGVHASGVRRDGRLIGRPLLLSAEAALRRSVITGPLR